MDAMAATNRSTPTFLLILVLVLSIGNVASTCVVVEEGGEQAAYRDESAEGQMQEEELDELDRETSM